jgi:hypothetical protein
MAKKPATQRVWLSYDLGLKGDYEGLYAWLANHGAKECGDNVATFLLEDARNVEQSMVMTELLKHVQLGQRDRIYLIWYDEVSKKIRGKFLAGGRKPARWAGYGEFGGNGEDE